MFEFSAWLCGIADERMRQNVQAMKADGWTDDEIAQAMPAMIEQAERARLEALTQLERIMLEPDAPSHSVN
jgi:hypothetical protein